MAMSHILRRNGPHGQGPHTHRHTARTYPAGVREARVRETEGGDIMGTSTIDELRARVHGLVITPDDEGYEEARAVYNAMIDKRPAVIVRAANAGDVMAAVDHARDNGVDLAVRGGGHSVPGFGTCDGGVVIDLSGMRGVRVDPAARTARAEGGATLNDFNAATHAFGLATTGGIISTTGVAGLTLGGGIGYLSRGYGLSLRQPDLGRRRHRRRPVRGRERPGERGPVLGAPRRRRELRRGHGVGVPAPPGGHDLRRSDVLRARGRRRPAALVPRVHRRRARGVRRVPRVPDRTAVAVHPGGAPRRHVHRVRRVLVRTDRAGRGSAEARARRRPGGRRARRTDALPRAQQRLRRARPAGAPALLEGQLRHRADRRHHRRAPAARTERAGRQLDDAHLPDQRSRAIGSDRRTPRSHTARRTSQP